MRCRRGEKAPNIAITQGSNRAPLGEGRTAITVIPFSQAICVNLQSLMQHVYPL